MLHMQGHFSQGNMRNVVFSLVLQPDTPESRHTLERGVYPKLSNFWVRLLVSGQSSSCDDGI